MDSPIATAPDRTAAPRMMIVEDNGPFRASLVRFLREKDYEATGVGDGSDAEKLYSAFSPQVGVSDVRFPGMDGVALLQRTKVHR